MSDETTYEIERQHRAAVDGIAHRSTIDVDSLFLQCENKFQKQLDDSQTCCGLVSNGAGYVGVR